MSTWKCSPVHATIVAFSSMHEPQIAGSAASRQIACIVSRLDRTRPLAELANAIARGADHRRIDLKGHRVDHVRDARQCRAPRPRRYDPSAMPRANRRPVESVVARTKRGVRLSMARLTRVLRGSFEAGRYRRRAPWRAGRAMRSRFRCPDSPACRRVSSRLSRISSLFRADLDAPAHSGLQEASIRPHLGCSGAGRSPATPRWPRACSSPARPVAIPWATACPVQHGGSCRLPRG